MTSAAAIPALLDSILVFAHLRTFSTGEPILSPETATSAFYYLLNGAVEVSYTDRTDTRITVALNPSCSPTSLSFSPATSAENSAA